MLGSVARRSVVPETERTYLDNAVIEDITTCDGTVLRARVNRHTEPAPQVVLIHGWLGNDGSSYVRSAGARLWQAGFNTVRMNLRDHGDTEELNQDLYNSARTVEVVDLVDQYRQRNAGDTAVIGFSLGGNFALRVARDTGLPALAVCPAIDPGDTLHQIDHGPGALVYRNYFVRKWRASLVRKAQAFPARYDFSRAFTLRSVSALTDFFVRHHSDFSSTATYFDAYDLSGNALAGVSATILAAKDDPIIPHATIRSLPRSLDIVETDWGGHNAFLSDWTLASWCDEYVLDWCRKTLRLP